MSKSGRETLPDVREWSGGPPKCPGVVGSPFRMSGVVGRPSQMFGSCWEAPCMSRRLSRLFGSHWETLPDVREWSGGPPGYPSGRDALLDVREWSGGPPKCSGEV